MSIKYCYSLNEETYYGQYDSEDQAVDAAIDDLLSDDWHEDGDRRDIFIGEVQPCEELLRRLNHSRMVERIIEDLEETLCYEIAADDFIIDALPYETLTELGAEIVEIMLKRLKFNNYNVKPMKSVPVIRVNAEWEVEQ